MPAVGARPNTAFVGERSLLAADGRVDTDPSTLRVPGAGPLVYALGDASSAARPAVHNVLAAVPVLCASLGRDLLLLAAEQGKKKKKEERDMGPVRLFQEDVRSTQLVPMGRSKGVGAAMGFALPSFLVWLIKGRDYWLWTTGGLWSGQQWAKKS